MKTVLCSSAAVSLATLAISIELLVSANLLTAAGIPYVTDGGSLAVKFHPGTVLLGVAWIIACLKGGTAWMSQVAYPLWVFLILGAICILCTFCLTGPGNLIVLLDTFLPAGLVAWIMIRAPESAQIRLRHCMQALIAVGALLALGETVAQKTLVPLYLNEAAYRPRSEDFRPTSLFDHPLTGSVMMMVGLALAPRGNLRLLYRLLMWAALIAFGGRMALATSIASASIRAAGRTLHLVLRRDVRAAFVAIAAVGALFAAASLVGLMMASGYGERLAAHLYWDQSAQVRVSQWQILFRLDGWQLLFGLPRAGLLADINALRLATGVEVIENFWLLMFVSLGLIGFPIFLAMLGSLCIWAWRHGDRQARWLLVCVLLVASASNSLGRKSTLLVCLMGAICSLPRSPATESDGRSAKLTPETGRFG